MLRLEMTEWQRKVIQAVVDHKTYSEAAKYLGVKPSAVRAIFFKIRLNDDKAQEYHRAVLEYQRKLGPKKGYLI